MNTIKNRIAKLEKNPCTANRFCECYGIALEFEVIPLSLDEWKARVNKNEPTAERLPDNCDRCKKAVDKRFIKTTFEQFNKITNKRVNDVVNGVISRSIT